MLENGGSDKKVGKNKDSLPHGLGSSWIRAGRGLMDQGLWRVVGTGVLFISRGDRRE